MRQWYQDLFTGYARSYDRESFTQGTIGEVDFIESEIGSAKPARILDIGCGTGRHAIELARRGHRVTGIDLSADQLGRAREKARDAHVAVEFIEQDARNFRFDHHFDAAIMLCEGAFPLMETDEMNFEILRCAKHALAPGGRFILTTLNALFPLFHSTQEFINDNNTGMVTANYSFDLMTFRETSTLTIPDDNGKLRTLQCNERYYTPSEMRWLLASLGFKDIGVFGCTLGAFSRERELTKEDYEMLVVATA